MTEFHRGDRVTWQSHGCTAVGEVLRKITSDTEAGGRTVRASRDEPQHLVRSDHGGEAVHKPDVLTPASRRRPVVPMTGRPEATHGGAPALKHPASGLDPAPAPSERATPGRGEERPVRAGQAAAAAGTGWEAVRIVVMM